MSPVLRLTALLIFRQASTGVLPYTSHPLSALHESSPECFVLAGGRDDIADADGCITEQLRSGLRIEPLHLLQQARRQQLEGLR
jgi:hypothetical protein